MIFNRVHINLPESFRSSFEEGNNHNSNRTDQHRKRRNWPCNYAARNDCPRNSFSADPRRRRFPRHGRFLEKIEHQPATELSAVYRGRPIDQLATLRHTSNRNWLRSILALLGFLVLAAISIHRVTRHVHTHVSIQRWDQVQYKYSGESGVDIWYERFTPWQGFDYHS